MSEPSGTRIDLGPASAYAYAKSNGYTGTEAEFGQYLAEASAKAAQTVINADAAASSAASASTSKLTCEGYATGKQNGTDVSAGSPYYQNNAEYFKNQAMTYAQNASDSVMHYPKVENGYWYVWDIESGQYVNTNVQATGDTGQGVPSGGAAGQVLKKKTGTDYDTEWATDINSVTDIQINGASILNNGIVNIPEAGAETFGVVIFNPGLGIYKQNGAMAINAAAGNDIKQSSAQFKPIVPYVQHESVFYGLAKSAGDNTQAASNNAVGTYTDGAKSAIRTMLGAAASTDIPTVPVQDVQVNGTSVLSQGVANVPMAGASTFGAVKVDVLNQGVAIKSDGTLCLATTTDAIHKTGTSTIRPVMIEKQHVAAFYGLARAAGDSTQSASDNAVGTYTDDAKSAIRTMLGAIGDVQVNGTSILNQGVASVPIATSSTLGVVKIAGAVKTSSEAPGNIYISEPPDSSIKTGTSTTFVAPISKQHLATFYGLAKAAGDSTQSSSSNGVGIYTETAKSKIQSMLGIEAGVSLVENVSGTTPSITGLPNVRYVCGEVSSISITPPAMGSVEVIFESGTTPAILTVPSTIKWPEWFDAATLSASTTYRMIITDATYGAVMSWAS